jgi:hypothetical protein
MKKCSTKGNVKGSYLGSGKWLVNQENQGVEAMIQTVNMYTVRRNKKVLSSVRYVA